MSSNETTRGEPVFIDLSLLAKLINDDDPARIRKLATLFVEDARDTLREMDAAREHNDPETLGRLGHRLKSSSRMSGACGLGELCGALEIAGRDRNMPESLRLLAQLPPLVDDIARQVERETG